MKTDLFNEPNKTVFLQMVAVALGDLKQRLQHDYERAYPDLREIIHLVLDEEEAKAWNLTLFPHLLLPDLVEAHVARLGLQPADTNYEDILVPQEFGPPGNDQPAIALCGG